jgi:hypothetical protein
MPGYFDPVSALSPEEVNVVWTADLPGSTVDPTGQSGGSPLSVLMAFPVSSGDQRHPAPPVTWYEATWLTGNISVGFIAQCMVGPPPQGLVQLVSGTAYDVWSQIVGVTESPVKFAGTMEVY